MTVVAATFLVTIIGLTGLLLLFCVLFYSRDIIGLEERNYTGRLFRSSWRGENVWLWRVLTRLLRHSTVYVDDTSPRVGPLIYACHPHGMLAIGASLAVMRGAFDRPGTRTVLVVHGIFWWIPIVRDLMLALGCIDRSWQSIENALANGFSVAILPGGIYEMGPPATERPEVLPLIRRIYHCGFAPPLVPVFLANEETNCWIWHGEPNFLRRLRAYGQRTIGLSVGAPFLPRFWAWPPLVTHVGSVIVTQDLIDPKSGPRVLQTRCDDAIEAMQTAYERQNPPKHLHTIRPYIRSTPDHKTKKV